MEFQTKVLYNSLSIYIPYEGEKTCQRIRVWGCHVHHQRCADGLRQFRLAVCSTRKASSTSPRAQEKSHCCQPQARTQTDESSQANHSQQAEDPKTAARVYSSKVAVQDSPWEIILKPCQLHASEHTDMHEGGV